MKRRATVRSSGVDPRDRIIAAAIPLFARRGLRGTTWDDIAAGAGFARRSGTIFNYFPSKSDIVRAAVQSLLDELSHRRPAPAYDDPVDDARSWAAGLLEEIEQRRDLREILGRDEDVDSDIRDTFAARILERTRAEATAMLRRHVPPDSTLDLDAIAAVGFGAIWGHVRSAETVAAVSPDIDDARFLDAVGLLIGSLLTSGDRAPSLD